MTAGIVGNMCFNRYYALRTKNLVSWTLKAEKGVNLVRRVSPGILPIPAVSVAIKHSCIDFLFYHVVNNVNRPPGQRYHGQ